MKTQNLQQQKWYVIDSQLKGKYSHKNEIKFLTNSLESCLCDYSDAYILVTGNITVTRRNAANAAFNGSLWNFKRNEIVDNANVTNDDNFLPRVKMENFNIEIDGKNFHDQPINDLIEQYDEIRKISTGRGNDYITGCLLGFAKFEKKIQINCS